jgi:hypothetical protein
MSCKIFENGAKITNIFVPAKINEKIFGFENAIPNDFIPVQG